MKGMADEKTVSGDAGHFVADYLSPAQPDDWQRNRRPGGTHAMAPVISEVVTVEAAGAKVTIIADAGFPNFAWAAMSRIVIGRERAAQRNVSSEQVSDTLHSGPCQPDIMSGD